MVKAKTTSLSQIIIFVVVLTELQIMAVSHSAAHGDVNHSHDGISCVFQLTSDTTPSFTADSLDHAIDIDVLRQVLRHQNLVSNQHNRCANSIRAPPTFPTISTKKPAR